jgi:phosphatidylglycerol:prolipoprotein diacylglycerol transferase
MEFHSPGAIALALGPLTIRWYGVMIALGFVAACVALTAKLKKWDLNAEPYINCALIVFMGGIAGARLYFVALSWDYFRDHLPEIVQIWHGGISIHGGIIGGAICGFAYCRRAQLAMLKAGDLITSVVPLAQAIGRWGNFFNSELFGKPVPADFPLKLFIPIDRRPSAYINDSYFHPTFLYESAWDFCLFLILYYFALEKLRKFPGAIFALYLVGYSIGRALIEPMRLDSIIINGVQAPFVASLVSLALGVLWLCIIFVRANSLKRNGLENK